MPPVPRNQADRRRSRCGGNATALARGYREAVAQRARNAPAFRTALVEEVMRNLAEGEVEIALAKIQDVAGVTAAFGASVAGAGIQESGVARMLGGSAGNPRVGDLDNHPEALGRHSGLRLRLRR